MEDDVLNIFDQKEPAEPINAPADPPLADPPAEPKGDEPAAPPAAETKDEARHVPYEALKDERTKRQNLEREIEDFRRREADRAAQQRLAQIESIEDPDQRIQAAQQEWQMAMIQDRLNASQYHAEKQHGADYVREVVNFFNDPQHSAMTHQFLRTPDPFEAAVDYYKRAKAFDEIGNDPEAYKARVRAELASELSPAKLTAPPPSVAGAPASGGKSNPVGSGFDELFGEN